MTRTHDRADVRRAARAACRARSAASPIRLKVPLLTAVLVIAATAVATTLAGLPMPLVLGSTLAVAVAGAVCARRILGSLAAGIGMLLIRPYAAGERLRISSPSDGSLVEVVRLGLVNTTLATPDGVLVVPNTHLMRGLPLQSEPPRDVERAGCR